MISNRPVLVRIIIVLFVAVSASLGLLALDGWQEGIAARQLRLERMARLLQDVSGRERRAIAEWGVSTEAARQWPHLRARLRAGSTDLPQVTPTGSGTAAVPALELYLSAIDREFEALAAGNHPEALRINQAVVEPAFAALSHLLDAETEQLALHSAQATHGRTWGSVALLFGAALSLTFLLWRHERSRRRVDRLAVERQALEQSRTFFERLLQNSADSVIALDAEGRIAYHSPNSRALIDPQGPEFFNRSFAAFLGPDEASDYDQFLRQIGENVGRPQTLECNLVGTGDRRTAVELVGMATPEPTGSSQIVLNIREIGSRRRMEDELRQAQKMEAVGRLAGGVAHDFNNLLTAMQGYAQLLEMELSSNSRLLSFVAEIQSAANRAGGLTRQLLAYSRKQILSLQVLEPGLIIRSMESMLRRLIRADITLTTKLAADIGRIKADAGQLEQVIMNLALNARDAMPSGGRLTIEAENVTVEDGSEWAGDELPPGSYVALKISDTGHGMPAEVRDHIFEPFFTTKAVGQGTGLGLSTVYGIVKQSGGHVTVESEPGAGTTFKVFLPRVDDASSPVVPKSRVMVRPERDHGTILLVEDEPQVRALLRETLGTVGYQVLEAEDGRHGVEVYRAHGGPIDLIVTDMIMPGMNGHELVQTLQREQPDLLPIYMSGHTESGILARGILRPGLRFLQKPFKPARLLLTVREALAERRGAAAA